MAKTLLRRRRRFLRVWLRSALSRGVRWNNKHCRILRGLVHHCDMQLHFPSLTLIAPLTLVFQGKLLSLFDSSLSRQQQACWTSVLADITKQSLDVCGVIVSYMSWRDITQLLQLL